MESKGETADKENMKKLNHLKKKALKSILEYNSMFNIKFLLAWTKTYNFSIWQKSFYPKICALSPQSGFYQTVKICYENGDYYEGNFVNGIRSGTGKKFEQSTGLVYTGDWFEDFKHGNGIVTNATLDYSYDG